MTQEKTRIIYMLRDNDLETLQELNNDELSSLLSRSNKSRTKNYDLIKTYYDMSYVAEDFVEDLGEVTNQKYESFWIDQNVGTYLRFEELACVKPGGSTKHWKLYVWGSIRSKFVDIVTDVLSVKGNRIWDIKA